MFFGKSQNKGGASSGLQCRAALIEPKQRFLCQVRADMSAERHTPTLLPFLTTRSLARQNWKLDSSVSKTERSHRCQVGCVTAPTQERQFQFCRYPFHRPAVWLRTLVSLSRTFMAIASLKPYSEGTFELWFQSFLGAATLLLGVGRHGTTAPPVACVAIGIRRVWRSFVAYNLCLYAALVCVLKSLDEANLVFFFLATFSAITPRGPCVLPSGIMEWDCVWGPSRWSLTPKHIRVARPLG